jgi:hypothetical protein
MSVKSNRELFIYVHLQIKDMCIPGDAVWMGNLVLALIKTHALLNRLSSKKMFKN